MRSLIWLAISLAPFAVAQRVSTSARCGSGFGFTCQGSQWGNCCRWVVQSIKHDQTKADHASSSLVVSIPTVAKQMLTVGLDVKSGLELVKVKLALAVPKTWANHVCQAQHYLQRSKAQPCPPRFRLRQPVLHHHPLRHPPRRPPLLRLQQMLDAVTSTMLLQKA
jgi:hypothetical protein